MISQVIGSVVQVHIQKQFLRCFSLLPVPVTTVTAMHSVEAPTATIGHPVCTIPVLTSALLTASTYTTTTPLWTTPPVAVRMGTLSVASRNDKSLRERDLEFSLILDLIIFTLKCLIQAEHADIPECQGTPERMHSNFV